MYRIVIVCRNGTKFISVVSIESDPVCNNCIGHVFVLFVFWLNKNKSIAIGKTGLLLYI